jgi:ssDNA-binding Zn-finger/Zn-ribbon topoisomerase 1
MSVQCYCGADARLRRSKYGPFWSCSLWPECDGTVGCHPGTTTPLGTLADKATRQARIKAHDAFDALWQPLGKSYRATAYRMLAEELEVDEAHMGEMSREDCERVVEWAEALGPEDVGGYAEMESAR